MIPRLGRHALLAAVVAGLVARLLFGLGYWRGKPMTHDEREYLALAVNIANGRGFTHELPSEPVDPSAERFGRAPLYPAFLALFVKADPALASGRLPDAVPAVIKIAQAAVGAVGVWLIGVLAGRVGGFRMGAAAGWIAAVYPPLVWISAYALSESLYSTLSLACVAVLSPLGDTSAEQTATPRHASRAVVAPGFGPVYGAALQSGGGRAILGGIIAGAAVLTRPATLVFLPLIALLLIRRRHHLAAILVLVAAMIVVLPWTVRNARVYGRFVLVASEGGITFWTGNHPDARGEGDLAANPHLKQLNLELRARHPGLSPEELEPVYYREALAWIRAEPLSFLGLIVRKFFYLWFPVGPSYTLHSNLYYLASVISYGLLLPAAIVGYLQLVRSRRRPATLWTLAASAVFVCLIFFPQERFRIPILDPTLIVCAAALASERRAGSVRLS